MYILELEIIARLNNCALLNFRAFRIYLWLKNAVVAHGHIIQYIHKIQLQYYINTHAHYQEFIAVKFLRGLVVIAISQLLDLRKNFASYGR